jgi:ATP-binding cassette subfamily G (WHITE) protein 5 (sterolin 1)
LAGNNTSSDVSGEILLGGQQVPPTVLREQMSYVMQDDSHLPQLTVRETFNYAALLRLPADMSEIEKLDRVEWVLSELGLRNVANTKVGGGYVRGVSGGERRRVSIGVQLLKDPKILLLDEPTSGLDAFNANNIVSTLSKLSQKNKTIIFTIHQPRSDIFPLLDSVLLLSQGRTAYFGRRDEIIDYFSGLGFPCDIYSNPLDYYIDVVSVDRRSDVLEKTTVERLENLVESYQRSPQTAKAQTLITNSTLTPVDKSILFNVRKKPSFWKIVPLLAGRLIVNLNRSFSAVYDRVTQTPLFGFLMWIFIIHFGNDQTSVQNRTGFLYEVVSGPLFIGMINAVALFPEARNLYYRERVDSLYSGTALVLSYILSFLPYSLASIVLFSCLSYWATGLYPSFARFCIFFVCTFILHIFGEIMTIFFLGTFYDPNQANSATSLVIAISALLGSGFLRSAEKLPEVLRYLGYGTIFKYASEIIYANEFEGLELTCSPLLPCEYPTGDDYLNVMYPGATERFGLNFAIITIITVGMIFVSSFVFTLNRTKLR